MRTLIISDLHLGNGGPYDVFEGAEALPALIDHLSTKGKLNVVVNGDAVDFLMNDDPLELDVNRAVAQARSIAEYARSARVFKAFGSVLAAGGNVTIRMGNHDIELFFPEVQDVFRGALGQSADVAARLEFSSGNEPAILDIGGARVLVTHGEQNDTWNKIDYEKLRAAGDEYEYAPGSALVKKILNPGVSQHEMRFLSLLKPDFQGAALSALAVDPTSAKALFQSASMSIMWQLFRRENTPFMFTDSTPRQEPDLDLDKRVADAALDESEIAAIEQQIADAPVPLSFSSGNDGALQSARTKLMRAALSIYARMQKRLTGNEADTYFQLDPDENEWNEAKRLAEKYNAKAVIIGHTHAARFRHDSEVLYANTGTWIGLMRLPSVEAAPEDWAAFLEELRKNKTLDAKKQNLAKVITRFTAVLLSPHDRGGASISLVEWADEHLSTLRSGWIPGQRR